MEITDIEVHNIEYEVRDFLGRKAKPFHASYGTFSSSEHVIVKITTDEGIFGVGESMTFVTSTAARTHLRPQETSQTVSHVIRDLLAPHLIGEDALEIDKIHYIMESWVNGHKSAKAGIDMAIYDILGKFYKTPICRLLGGCYRTEMRTLGAVPLGEPQEMAKNAISWAERGHAGFQMKIGGYTLEPDKDVERVKQVRDAVGDEMIILADANQSYSPALAIRTFKKFERYNVYVEQPTPAYDIKGLARVANALDVPVLADESLSYGGRPIRNLIEIERNNAADILKLKSMPIGGIRTQMRIIRLAEEYEIPVLMDTDGPGTRVLCTALAQVGANLNPRIYTIPILISFRMLKPDIVSEGGIRLLNDVIKLPDGPGLGLEINKELLKP